MVAGGRVVLGPERFGGVDVDRLQGHGLRVRAGRRICPGLALAVVVMELGLASLLFRFDWELPGGAAPEELDMDEALGITARRKSDLSLHATTEYREDEEVEGSRDGPSKEDLGMPGFPAGAVVWLPAAPRPSSPSSRHSRVVPSSRVRSGAPASRRHRRLHSAAAPVSRALPPLPPPPPSATARRRNSSLITYVALLSPPLTAPAEYPTGFALSSSLQWCWPRRQLPLYPAAANDHQLALLPWPGPTCREGKEGG
ncbi:ent-isokaurene C2-hydroxylase-like [Panicum miliaceum]|uniref:Ent-isokaurene C2-hydroxylase-like n=1 Tax=Panicum miliaceum TaxID=4540 RepID=A0A3L6PJ71_PANMI|nr:ent-isokaurene C2-hydroxylase-like [Panicum miliaceum]